MQVVAVTTQDQLHTIITQNSGSYSVCIPIWETGRSTHPALDKIIALLISYGDTLYMISCGHTDLPILDVTPVFSDNGEYMRVDNKLAVLYHYKVSAAKDMWAEQFITNQVIHTLSEFDTKFHTKISMQFRTIRKYGHIIPLVKHVESAIQYLSSIQDTFAQEDNRFYNTTVIPTIHWIESSGLKVDPKVLGEHYPLTSITQDKFVYSKYNIFNATGRPSNSNGGINFLAINKASGSRNSFISRFGDKGRLVQFDFDSYHLRLLAKRVGVELSLDSVHLQLAQQYYETDQITPEMYEAAKQTTFANLYGSAGDSSILPSPIREIKMLEHELWEQYSTNGHLYGPISNRPYKVPTASPSKVLNYYVQCLEFESTIWKLNKLRQRLVGFKSKPILYTYDALLIDVVIDESRAIKDICTEILEEGGFPIKTSVGTTYHNLITVA